MQENRIPIWEVEYDLGQVRTWQVEGVSAWAVMSFDGAAESVVLRRTRDPVDSAPLTLQIGLGDNWQDPVTVWVVNNVAQTGKTIKIKWGGRGAFVTAAGSTAILARTANQPAIAFGRATVGVAAAALTAQSIPDGFSVALKALASNAGKIYVGGAGVAVATGFELLAGDPLSLNVTNLNLIYAIADQAAQGLCWIVEAAS